MHDPTKPADGRAQALAEELKAVSVYLTGPSARPKPARPVATVLRDVVACLEQLPSLRNPVVVHVAMLRGEIAKPPLRDLLHAYGEDALSQFDRGAASPSVEPVAAREVASEWQPIATAPRDGTHILACHAGRPYDDTYTFNQAPPSVVHWFGWPEDAAGFYLSVALGEQKTPFEYTHWKPLGSEPCDTKRLQAEMARFPKADPTLVCSNCGIDRFKAPCPGTASPCRFVGEALASQPPAPQAGVREPLTESDHMRLFAIAQGWKTIGEKDPWFWFSWGVELGEQAHGIAKRRDAKTVGVREPAVQVAEAVAWLRPDTGEVCHAERKRLWIESDGGYRNIAERYTVPLYAAPLPQQAGEPQVGPTRPWWMTRDVSPKDCPEDFVGENGCYECKCLFCESSFFGYKRRVACKECRPGVSEALEKVGAVLSEPPASPATQPAPALPVIETSPDVAKMVEEAKHLVIDCANASFTYGEYTASDDSPKLFEATQVANDALRKAIEALGAAVQPAAQPVGEAQEREAFETWWQRSGLTKYRETAMAAWEAALSARPQPEQSGWISVEDRLPEKFVEVLIAFAGQSSLPSVGQFTDNPHDHGGWCYPSECFGATQDGDSYPIVTHWQVLPDAPTKESHD